MPKDIIVYNQNSKLVLAKTKNLLKITNNILKSNYELLIIDDNDKEYTDIVEIIDNRYLLTGSGKYPGLSSSNKINLWDLKKSKLIKSFNAESHVDIIYVKEFSCFIQAVWDTINCIDIKTGNIIKTFPKTKWPIVNMILTKDNKYIIVQTLEWQDGFDYTLELFDIKTGFKEILYTEQEDHLIDNSNLINIEEDKILFSTLTSINLINIENIEDIKITKLYKSHTFDICNMLFLKEVIIISEYGYNNGNIIFLDNESFEKFDTIKISSSSIESLIVSNDEKYLFCGTRNDGKIIILDLLERKIINKVNGHINNVASLNILSDKYLISGEMWADHSKNPCLKIWDIQDIYRIKELATFISYKNGEWIIYTSDNYYNCSKNAEKYIRFSNKGNTLDITHPIYKNKKKDKLLENLIVLNNFETFFDELKEELKDELNEVQYIYNNLEKENIKEIEVSPIILDKLNIEYVYHMTHINNLQNILQYGLLSHNNNVAITRIDNEEVNSRRNFNDPIYDKNIHSYVPFYFNPKNPMLYVKRNIQENLVILAFNRKLIYSDYTIFTDGNASANGTQFFNDINDLDKLNWECLNANTWYDFEDGKRTRMSELLVPNKVDIDNLQKIYCNNYNTKKQVEQILQTKFVDIEINKDMFF